MRPRPLEHGAQSPANTTIDLSGSCFGTSYLLIEEIGNGATGRVWRALDRGSGEQVAVKLLRRDLMNDPKAVTRFMQERSILLMLRHHNIVGIRDLLLVDDSLGLVMDLIGGGSLREYLRRHGTLTPAAATGLLSQIAAALAQAHGRGIVHRDLKPDNILIHPDGTARPGGRTGVPHVRLTDFGIARLLDAPGVTTPQALVGTPNYLAPEVITGGQPSPAVDIYALGVLLYELLFGRPPYAGGLPVVVLRRHLECEPNRHPGVPDSAWQTVLACMAKEPDRRPSAAELATTLDALSAELAGEPAAPRAPDPCQPDQTPSPAERLAPSARIAGRPGGNRSRRPAGRPGGLRGRLAGWRWPSRGASAGPAGTRGEGPLGTHEGRPGARRRRRGLRRWLPLLTLAVSGVLIASLGTPAGRLPGWLATAIRQGTTAASSGPAGGGSTPAQQQPQQQQRQGGVPPSAGGRPNASPVPSPSASPTRPGTIPVAELEAGTRPGRAHSVEASRRPPAPRPRATSRMYGPLRCTPTYRWDVGHPAVAMPCHATGPGIKLFGRLQALPGVQADVSLSLQDVRTGRTVAGPFTCAGLMFTDFAREHECGPFRAPGIDHGHSYAVVQRWTYTGRNAFPSGTARGDPFRW